MAIASSHSRGQPTFWRWCLHVPSHHLWFSPVFLFLCSFMGFVQRHKFLVSIWRHYGRKSIRWKGFLSDTPETCSPDLRGWQSRAGSLVCYHGLAMHCVLERHVKDDWAWCETIEQRRRWWQQLLKCSTRNCQPVNRQGSGEGNGKGLRKLNRIRDFTIHFQRNWSWSCSPDALIHRMFMHASCKLIDSTLVSHFQQCKH